MDITNIIAQGFGVLAYIIVGYSFYREKKLEILFVQFISSIVFGIHYYLLSGITGAACSFLSAIMMFNVYIYEKKAKESKKTTAMIMVAIMLTIISIITYENVFSVFPIVGTAIAAASFIFDSETFIRIVGVVAAGCWLVYGIICMSYSAMIFESILIITTTISIIKNRKKEINN